MTYEQWSSKADYLKKRYDYARHVGSAQTEAWRLNLLAHLEAEPDSDATPLPEITEPSTVDKFRGGWIQHHGSCIPVSSSKMVEVSRRNKRLSPYNSRNPAITFQGWIWFESEKSDADIIAYRVVKD